MKPLVLVTGATGYIGGRLVPRLIAGGFRVRCLVRDAQGRPWQGEVETVEGDVLAPDSLAAAMQGVSAAYYLIHSLGAGKHFSERDVQAARNFGAAAKRAGVARIIYCGGLGDPGTDLSAHLRSRHQTGDALRESGIAIGIGILKALFRREEEHEMDMWVVKYASRRSRIGDFWGDSSVRGARIRGVLASQASAGQRGLWAQGVEPELQGCSAFRRYRMNRMGGGPRPGLDAM